MSVEALNWALTRAPYVPVKKGSPSPAACQAVLIGLANHADPEGKHSFPSVATLCGYTALGERQVRHCLDRLEEVGIIRRSDPRVVAAIIRRADRRPQGWDLDITLRRERGAEPAPRGVSGVQSLHPVEPDGVQALHPDCHPNGGHGVQGATSRGAEPAPEPSMNQKKEEKRAAARTRKPTRQRAAELNATARRADTERLVTEWRKSHGDEPYAAKTYLALAQALDALEDRDGLSAAVITEMLRLWDERGGRSPKLIPHLRDEAARNVRAATAPPPVPAIRDQGPRPAPSRPRTGRGAKVQGWLDLAADLAAQEADQGQTSHPNLTVIEGEIA